MMLTSFFDLAGMEGGGGTFSIVTRMCLVIFLLLLPVFEVIFGVNLDKIFVLRVMICLSV